MNTNSALNSLRYSLPESLQRAVQANLEDWEKDNKIARLWQKDAALWANEDEAKWLGWLDIVERQIADQQKFADFQQEISSAGFTDVLLMGMGGSSLCPEVLAFTFGKQEGFPEFHILDSTDPAQIKTIEAKIDLQKTLFFVSSKSGSTLEPNIFKQYFFERVTETVGQANAGKQFIAITDPNSKMQKVAEADNFRCIFYGDPTIGGRFSALSDFGMIPLAAMGVGVKDFLENTDRMVYACKSHHAAENPGVLLGAILGTANKEGRDKLTIIASNQIFDLGAWLEQLIAESTGKNGKSIIPVDREELQEPENYGNDRLFVYLRLGEDTAEAERIEALRRNGQPVVEIDVTDVANLGQEFFRWEIATAVAGSIMGINTFNQPDVEFSKVETRKLTDQVEATGHLPAETPFYEGDGIKLFTDEKNLAELNKIVGDEKSLANYLKAHFSRIKTGDYFALLAYIEMNSEHETLLQEIRHAIFEEKHVATCLGFGPRFLHSTGQGYKGGANNGVFLQITADDAVDLKVPNQKYTFGTVKAAQARGDFQVLVDRNRRALRVHLGANVRENLQLLFSAIES
ncbi:MAG: bifunctional transaldolase/phosoglucose isomerase [Pyrinomonadaceae bacterium]